MARHISLTHRSAPPPPPLQVSQLKRVSFVCDRASKTLAGDMADVARTGAAKRRERRLRSWLRHERMTVAAALAEALHHSAPKVGAVPNNAPRSQKTARASGEHPGVLKEPEVQLEAATVGYVAPLLVVAPLAGGDDTTTKYLLKCALRKRQKEEEEERRKEKEHEELMKRAQSVIDDAASLSSASGKRRHHSLLPPAPDSRAEGGGEAEEG